MPYVVTESCVDVKDRSCVQECPVDCIYEGKRMMYIHPEECIDCGACEAACPVSAIFYHPELPEESERFDILSEAVRIARADPPRIETGDLTAELVTLAAEAPWGATLVVFHSAVLAYVDEPARTAKSALPSSSSATTSRTSAAAASPGATSTSRTSPAPRTPRRTPR